jgi:hypothetical protein
MSQPRVSGSRGPSIIWLGPVAVALWCGLIVNGWAYRDRHLGRTLESLNLAWEVLLAPALLLLILWLALAPATLRHRATALGLLIVPSVPIGFLACGQPGVRSNGLADFFDSLVTRVYFRELLSLSWLQLVLFVAFAVWGLRTLNHYVSHVHLHRSPVAPRSNGKRFRERLHDAYWSQPAGRLPITGGRLPPAHWVGLVACGAALAGIDLWNDYAGGSERCRPSVVSAGIIVLLAFLIVWLASQFYWRWWSSLSLGMGLGLFSGWPLVTRWAVAFEAGFLPTELIVQAFAIGTSLFLLVQSLVLLTLTHQMPRPLQPKPLGSAGRSPAVGDLPRARTAVLAESPARFSLWGIGWGMGLGLLWLLFGGLAYWLPRNLDLLTLVNADGIHFHDARLVAQLRKANGGEAKLAIRTSESLVDFDGDPTWHYPAGHIGQIPLFARQQGPGSVVFYINILELGGPWAASIEAIQRRAVAGDTVYLMVREPITDLARLRQLLAAGVTVVASIDLQSQSLPDDLLGNPRYYIRHVVNARMDVADWENLLAKPNPRWSLRRCSLPDRFPQNLTTGCRLIECDVSPTLFADIAEYQQSGLSIELYEIRAPEPFAGHDLVRFLAAGGILAGRPPLADLVADDFPLFFQRFVWGTWSRWGLSLRELLRDPQVLQQVLAQRTSLPDFVKFDAAGQITSLTLSPTRDCQVDRPWNNFPQLTELRLDLTRFKRDTRGLPSVGTVSDTYGFQAEAFPRLQRVVIGNVSGSELPPAMLAFLTDLFAQTNVQEVELELPCSDQLWQWITALEQVNRMTIDVSQLRRIARSEAEWLQGFSFLAAAANLQQVVIVDWDEDDLFNNDIGEILGNDAEEALTEQELTDILAAQAKRRAEIQAAWLQKIKAIAPQLEVEVRFAVPHAPESDTPAEK